MRAKEISALLALNSQKVVQMLLPNGSKKAGEWVIGDVLGTPGASLKVCLIGSNVGLWSDFATGQGGDLLDLWSLVKNVTLAEALIEAKLFLNVRDTPALRPLAETVNKISKKTFKLPDTGKLQLLPETSLAANYLKQVRKLAQTTLSKFKISVAGDDIAFPYFSRDEQLQFVKYLKLDRGDGKKQMWVEKDCKPCLFGWQAVPKNCREITICEGEIDAMSLWQCGIPSLSIPLGAGAAAKHDWIAHDFDNLAHFDKIFLCMDMDDAGHKSAKEIAERLGFYRCPIVQLPYKDANECIQNGIGADAMQYCFSKASTMDPKELKNSELYGDATWKKLNGESELDIGYSPLWGNSQGKILFRPNELSLWTGINGHGKSQFLGQIIVQMICQGAKVCIASMEMKPEILLARMCRQATALRQPSREYVGAVFEEFNNKLWLFELIGTAKSQRLLEVFLYARQRYGVDVFVIDSFLTLDIAEDDYKAQKVFMEQLRDFKNEHHCHVHMVMHPRKGTDETLMPNKLDIKGSGALSDLADNCFVIWRDKVKELITEKHKNGHYLSEKDLTKLGLSDCLWLCDKQRNGEWEGVLRFWFDKDSLQYRDVEHQKPKPLIQWSQFDDATTNTHG